MIPFAGVVAGWTLKKVLPWLIVGVLALAFAGLWAWDAKTIDSLTVERDTFRDRAAEQAAGLVEARLVIADLNTQVEGLVSLWRKTRAEAERVTAETTARGKTIAKLDRKLKEMTDAGADPVDIALFNLDCLRRIEAGDPTAACAGPD